MTKLLIPLLLASAVAAQPSCSQNLVPNGELESILQNPWHVTGPVTATFPSFATNKATASTCLTLSPSGPGFGIRQPVAFSLRAGVRYEVAFDAWSNSNVAQIDLGLTSASRRSLIAERMFTGHTRFAVHYISPADAVVTLDIAFTNAGGGGVLHRVDNVTVRASEVLFTLDGPRQATLQPFRVDGSPNRTFGVFLGLSAPSSPIAISGCSYGFGISPPIYALAVGTVGSSGRLTGSFFVPWNARNVPIFWQAGEALPCLLGCEVELGL